MKIPTVLQLLSDLLLAPFQMRIFDHCFSHCLCKDFPFLSTFLKQVFVGSENREKLDFYVYPLKSTESHDEAFVC